MDDFHKRLSERRAALGLSQNEAAAATGATLRNYQRWEAGDNLPHLRQLPAIAAGLRTTPSELLGGDDPAAAPRSSHELQLEARLSRIEELLAGIAAGPPGRVLDEADRLIEQELPAQDSRRAAG